MATDYDAPRKTDDDTDSIEALKERVPDSNSGNVDVDDNDGVTSFDLPSEILVDVDDTIVLPEQKDEFTCSECFLVKHKSLLDHMSKHGPVCTDCA